MNFRISRSLCAAAIAVAFPSLAHAQATFTWEGLTNGAIPAPQNGVALGNGPGAPSTGYFQATNQGAGMNVFGSGSNLGCNVTPSGSNCGFNGNASPVNMYSTSPTGTFTLNGGYFTALPSGTSWMPATGVTVTGYGVGGAQLFTQSISLTGTPTLATFNWAGVNNVLFTPVTNGVAGSGFFLADDITVNNAVAPVPPVTTTPEPSSLALLGSGFAGLVPLVRRKRRA